MKKQRVREELIGFMFKTENKIENYIFKNATCIKNKLYNHITTQSRQYNQKLKLGLQ